MPRGRVLAPGSGDTVRSRRAHADASPSKALEYYRESIELARTMGYLGLVGNCLPGIAVIALTSGEAKTAATLLGFRGGFAERFGGLSPREKDELDEAIAQVRESLGNEAFDAAWTEGGA